MPLSITPVYDRTLTDVETMTAKGYIHLADWERIYDNSDELNDLVLTETGYSVPFSTSPGTVVEATIPTIAQLNALIGNIEAVRAYIESIDAGLMSITGMVELKDDWLDGPNVPSPNYRHVNDWERVTELLYNRVETYTVARWARTGVARTGASLTLNNKFRG